MKEPTTPEEIFRHHREAQMGEQVREALAPTPKIKAEEILERERLDEKASLDAADHIMFNLLTLYPNRGVEKKDHPRHQNYLWDRRKLADWIRGRNATAS